MLPVVVNAEAEKILKGVLREVNVALKLVLLPGAAAAAGAAKRPARAASAGSAAELAEKHPVVQEARRLFGAEISNVIDLRDSKG
jgi:DNA polymerase-3 subunit gamma/tau